MGSAGAKSVLQIQDALCIDDAFLSIQMDSLYVYCVAGQIISHAPAKWSYFEKGQVRWRYFN